MFFFVINQFKLKIQPVCKKLKIDLDYAHCAFLFGFVIKQTKVSRGCKRSGSCFTKFCRLIGGPYGRNTVDEIELPAFRSRVEELSKYRFDDAMPELQIKKFKYISWQNKAIKLLCENIQDVPRLLYGIN